MEKRKNRDIIDKIVDIDMRYIFLLVFIALAVPLLKPIGLPIEIGVMSQMTFDIVEALPEGSYVVFVWDASSGTWMDQGPGSMILLRHFMKMKGVKVIGFSQTADGPLFWESTMKSMGTYGKVYGEDFVYLGFIPGGESAVASVALDTWAAFSNLDFYGNKLEDLPMMENYHSADDTTLLVQLPSGSGYLEVMRQWQMPYDLPFICVPLGSVATNLEPYLETGQIDSWIAGTREAAEYEILIKEPGPIVATMDAQSVGHILVAILLIIGNIFYFIKKGRGV